MAIKNIPMSGTFWDKILRVTQLLAVVGLIFTIGVTWGQAQERMFDDSKQKNTTVTHADPEDANYKDVHMSFQEKQEEFVTRREYELLIKGQDEIKSILRDLNKK